MYTIGNAVNYAVCPFKHNGLSGQQFVACDSQRNSIHKHIYCTYNMYLFSHTPLCFLSLFIFIRKTKKKENIVILKVTHVLVCTDSIVQNIYM